ncbi:Probable membrane protein Cj0124c [hydrothermal vent metagenome]|uniref:Probable membrane protein Cj0124c n=1 Tax=hydrothermal vent metagenome TaxID=652676 RepID=A0A1W1BC85_9ZZZZ
MRLGLYILASIVLMAMVGGFIYTINPNEYSHNFFGVYIEMPIAIWVMIPMFILMLASLVHMMFYGAKNFFKFKRWEKDSEKLNNALYWSLLHEPKPHKFNLPKLKETASLLQVSNIKVNSTVDGVSEKIQSALNIISELDRGECIDFRSKKLANILSIENPLVITNHLNCLKKDENFTEEVLQFKDKYSDTVFKKALESFANSASFFKARKYSKIFNRESFITLISRVTRDNDLGLTLNILDEFIVDLNSELKCSDFLLIANITKKQLSPDENLKLFKGYDKKYTKAQTAYLYLLFDYEMIDKAGEYLDEHDADEFIRFRALYDLKKEHTKYKITDLMNIKHICNDA